jgi:hypothetical protein
MANIKTPIEIYQGDTFKRDLTFKNQDGTPVNITGATIKLTVKAKATDTAVIIEQDAIIVDGPNGTAQLVVADTVTKDITVDQYVYDIGLDLNNEKTTILIGNFKVQQPVNND